MIHLLLWVLVASAERSFSLSSVQTAVRRFSTDLMPPPPRFFSKKEKSSEKTTLPEEHRFPELERQNKETVARVLELADESSQHWEPVVLTERIRVWRLKSGDHRHACVLAKGVITASPAQVYGLFAEARRAKDFNEYCDQCVDIATLNHNTKISWSVTKPFASGLFKPRDFVTLCHYVDLTDGSKCIVNRATTHALKPEAPQYQRAEVILAGNIVKPLGPDKTHLTLLTQVNPKGAIDNSIGAKIANQIVKRSPVAFFDAVERAASSRGQ